jgi:hypothetical protein
VCGQQQGSFVIPRAQTADVSKGGYWPVWIASLRSALTKTGWDLYAVTNGWVGEYTVWCGYGGGSKRIGVCVCMCVCAGGANGLGFVCVSLCKLVYVCARGACVCVCGGGGYVAEVRQKQQAASAAAAATGTTSTTSTSTTSTTSTTSRQQGQSGRQPCEQLTTATYTLVTSQTPVIVPSLQTFSVCVARCERAIGKRVDTREACCDVLD